MVFTACVYRARGHLAAQYRRLMAKQLVPHRVEDAGYRWSRYGENIVGGQTSVAEVVDGWMRSPEHRAKIRDCRLHQMGLGVAFAADGDDEPYWVQDFATPKRLTL